MLGYLDDPEATAATLRVHADGRTWLHTGDIGTMDADGFFYFASRLKRMIKSSGFNVYPAEVEAVLCEHPAVAEACVVGVPGRSPGRADQGVRRAEGSGRGEHRVGRGADRPLPPAAIKWSCPRDVEFLRELPVTRLGKIDCTALVQQDVAKVEAGARASTPAPS